MKNAQNETISLAKKWVVNGKCAQKKVSSNEIKVFVHNSITPQTRSFQLIYLILHAVSTQFSFFSCHEIAQLTCECIEKKVNV